MFGGMTLNLKMMLLNLKMRFPKMLNLKTMLLNLNSQSKRSQ